MLKEKVAGDETPASLRHVRGLLFGCALLLGVLCTLGGPIGCGECRYDVECDGNNLCVQGRCTNNKPTPTQDSGTPPVVNPPPTNCLEGEKRQCYTGPAGTEGKGICKSGEQVCNGGVFGPCVDEVKPGTETCDGVDNNCSGAVDDGNFPANPCVVPNAKGPCQTGVEKCTGGKIVCTQTVQASAQEVCGDGVDNNCNGQTDETPPCSCKAGTVQPCYRGSPATRGKGICKDGQQVCGTNQTWGPCSGDTGPGKEVCDGADNDCNGQVDDNLTQVCGVTKGTCLAGVRRCIAGSWGQACENEVGPTNEVCDGKDNDCDGQTDENLTQACSVPCGSGVQTCTGGSWGACKPSSSSQEICDNKDNDCDGQTDENLTRTCSNSCGSGTETCDRGQWLQCTAPKPGTEICDGKDNDCDGQTDETPGPETQISKNLTQTHYYTSVVWTGKEFAVLYRIDKSLYLQRIDAGGTAIGSPKVVYSTSSTGYFYSNIALFWTGTGYAAFWSERISPTYYYKMARLSSTGTRTALTTLGSGGSEWSYTRVAWNGSSYGVARRVYSSGYFFKFQRYTSTGTKTGTEVEVVATANRSKYISTSFYVAANSSYFGILFSQNRATYTQAWLATISSTGTIKEVDVSQSTSGSSTPRFVAGSGSYFLVFYTQSAGSAGTQLFAGRVTASSGFRATPNQVTTTSSSPLNVHAIPESTSSFTNYRVTWTELINSKRQVFYQKVSYTGSPSGTKTQVSNTTGSTSYNQVALKANGHVGLFWIDSRTGRSLLWGRVLCGP